MSACHYAQLKGNDLTACCERENPLSRAKLVSFIPAQVTCKKCLEILADRKSRNEVGAAVPS